MDHPFLPPTRVRHETTKGTPSACLKEVPEDSRTCVAQQTHGESPSGNKCPEPIGSLLVSRDTAISRR